MASKRHGINYGPTVHITDEDIEKAARACIVLGIRDVRDIETITLMEAVVRTMEWRDRDDF